MNWEEERMIRVSRFVKVGLAVLSALLVIAIAAERLSGGVVSKAVNGTSLLEGLTTTIKSKKLPIYCVKTEEKKVALTFDGAWGNEDTATLLGILKRQNVKATFFFTGGWMEHYPEDIKTILAEGHEVGNHSENHKQMSRLSKEECIRELTLAHDRIKQLTGIDMTLFRPPFGDYNDTVIEAANELGYHVIQWDVDSLDWKDYGKDSILHTVVDHKHLGNGSIILMHNGAKYTKEALEALIMGVREKGYEFVKVSELIYTENYKMDHEGRQYVDGPMPTPSPATGSDNVGIVRTQRIPAQ